MAANIANIKGIAWVSFLMLLTGLAGCGGSDGDDGAPGKVGQAVVQKAEGVVVTIDAVSNTDTTPVIDFTVTDEAGNGFIGLTSVRANFAKLVPSSNGDSSFWDAYVTSDRNGELVDHGDGSYTYTLAQATPDGGATYDATATHRVALRASGDFPTANAVYTWQPSTGATTGIPMREIVTVASCNECHNELGFHGNSYKDTRYCVTCHTPELVDEITENTADFKVMIHKLHRGRDLPSVLNGVDYYVRPPSRSDGFSTVGYPQDIRNCTKCHDSADEATPQAANWLNRPNKETCGSCHDDVTFDQAGDGLPEAWNVAHSLGPQADNGACVTCHQEGGMAGSVAQSHVPAEAARANFAFNILGVTGPAGGSIAAGSDLEVNFEIVDPENGNSRYALTEPAIANGSIRLIVNWDTEDYVTTSSAVSNLQNPANVTVNVDGSFTAVLSPLNAAATGSGVAAIIGAVRSEDWLADNTGTGDVMLDNVSVKPAINYFAITDAEAEERRQVVSADRCNQCHGNLQITVHSNQRSGDPMACVICHSSERRSSNAANPELSSATDFKRVIHALHASGLNHGEMLRETAYRPSFEAKEYHFPGKLNQCGTCHEGETYMPPLDSGVRASLLRDTDANAATEERITPTASVCSACHDSSLAQTHMELNGAVFNADVTAAVETCAICHSDGRVAGVKVMHGIND